MISLDQIRVLEQKIEAIVSKIKELTEENLVLHNKNSQLEQENSLLKTKLSAFEQDQEKIEQGIINALDRLNSVENSILLAAGVLNQENSTETSQTPQENHTAEVNDVSYNQPTNDYNASNNLEEYDSLIQESGLQKTYEQPQNQAFDIF